MILGAFISTLGAAGSGFDVTPNAVNWVNISGAGSGSNANQTISGIDTSIEIAWSYSGTGVVNVLGDVNDGAGQMSPRTVSSGDTLSFTASSVAGGSGTVTVVNNSDGGATLDTFTVNLSGV